MAENVRVVTVDATNVEQERFFCYKSKPRTEGYRSKLTWLHDRFAEGMKVKILYEGKRSVGFIEYMPGEMAWRAAEAPNYLLIHCLWVVGKGKGKGYGSQLISLCMADARELGKRGVAVVASSGNWLANDKVFLRNGFQKVDAAPPEFTLLAYALGVGDGPDPRFPTDWEARAQAFGSGATIPYADQCPYMLDAVAGAVKAFEDRGIPARTVKLTDAARVRATAPSPYGVFSIVLDGKLFCYHYLGRRELRQLDELVAERSTRR